MLEINFQKQQVKNVIRTFFKVAQTTLLIGEEDQLKIGLIKDETRQWQPQFHSEKGAFLIFRFLRSSESR